MCDRKIKGGGCEVQAAVLCSSKGLSQKIIQPHSRSCSIKCQQDKEGVIESCLANSHLSLTEQFR